MREIRLAKLDKTRPVVILTRELALGAMNKVTVAPITSTVRGLSSEVIVDERNGLDHRSAISLDNVLTISQAALGRRIGFLTAAQEAELSRAVILAYDLALPLD